MKTIQYQKHRYQNPLHIVLSTDVMWTAVHTWKFERSLSSNVRFSWSFRQVNCWWPTSHVNYLYCHSPHPSLSPNFSTWSDSTNSKYKGDISNLDISWTRASFNHNKISGHKSRASIYCCNMPFQQNCFSYQALTMWRRISEYTN
jgi:hypothetical protein